MMRRGTWRERWMEPWMIFWVGFVVRVLVIVIGHTYRLRSEMEHFNFGFEAGRIARSLVEGHGYANPFNGPSGPTAWLPPVYPLLMAAAFKVFGVYTNAAALAVLVVNSLFSAAVAPAVYEIGVRLFDAKGLARRGANIAMPVAVWSAWVWAVYPAALQYAVHWFWEMSVSTCLFTWAVVVALRLREGQRISLWCGFGVLWGLVGLSNASLLICLPAVVVWVVWPQRMRWRVSARTWVGVAVMSVVFVAVQAPWVIRNERVLHAFIPTRSNLGIELYNSSLPMNDGFPWGTAMPMWRGDPVFQQYVRMGEVRFAAMRQREALANLRGEPGRFWRWTLDRVLFFWDATPHPPDRHPVLEYLRRLSYCLISASGLLGLALMLRRRVEGAGLFALCFALLPVPYYVVTVQPRFRHPLEPMIAVLAVYLFRSAEKRQVAESK